MSAKIKHPAQYSPPIIEKIIELIDGRTGLLIDPFAGPGQSLHQLVGPRRRVVGIEIEQPWVDAGSDLVRQGDACALPFRAKSVNTIVTSPVYGNRFSDHHQARDTSSRRSYTHDIRRQVGTVDYELAPANAGRYQFGSIEYESLHRAAWAECWRVARPGALFLLNVSDFYRRGARVRVASWHVRVVEAAGFDWVNGWLIPTRRMGHGENRDARADGEWLYAFTKREDA